ncbi:MAG TPA: AI-2E family transporter [Lachnospiraceae bacterium]|nr:AI-2E family transporter [Lachnospiraceae bacterium]
MNKLFDKKYMTISIYVIVTSFIILALFRIVDNAPILYDRILASLNWLLNASKPILIGFIIAYILNPIVTKLEGKFLKIKFTKHKARLYSVVSTLLIVFITIALLISLLIFSITNQIKVIDFNDIASVIGNLIDNLNDFYSRLVMKLNALNIESDQITTYLQTISNGFVLHINGFMKQLLHELGNITSSLSTFAMGLLIGIYFLIDGKSIVKLLNRISNAFLNTKWNKWVHILLGDLDTVFSGYLKGQILDIMFVAFAVSLVLLVIGVKLALVIGILTGLANLIPYLGSFVAYGLTTLVCIVNGDYKTLLISIIALFIVQFIDGNIVEPKILGNHIQMPPVLIIIFIIFGNALGGFLGMLLAVPVGGFLVLEFNRLLEYLENRKDVI